MFYELNIFDIKRKLPILKTINGDYIAGFNSVGDMELLIKVGQYLSNYIKENKIEFDVILTTELKGVPISQEIARNLNCDYVCLRKEKKSYMFNPICIKSEIITSGKTNYYISELDLNKLKNKRVIFVDDVFYTGSTFKSIASFAKNEKIQIVKGLFILKEGNENKLKFQYSNIDVFCCMYLPLPNAK